MQRIVHIGVGNFHRAHQAWYTAQSGGWVITGVVMSNHTLRNQLVQHDNAYLLGIWGSDGLRTQRISVYDDILLATDQPQAVIDRIADANAHVVTLTITEKGYYLNQQGDHLDMSAADIKADLAAEQPGTAIGLLAAGLVARARGCAGPLTVISCDNLSENGAKLRQALIDYLIIKAPDVLDWVSENVSFPNTMVDRITPRLSPAAQDEIANAANASDLSVVGTEAFTEWVIEDRFAAGKPDWQAAGAVLVDDVSSYEERKLRLLNASHSYLAYAGLLAGHRYVHEAIADPVLYAGVCRLWDEAGVTVARPACDTLEAYREALLDRFSVAHMRHELRQIAMDGSLKLKERLVPILRYRADRGLSSPQIASAIRSWIAFVKGAVASEAGLDDPNAEAIRNSLRNASSLEAGDAALLALLGVSPQDIA